jgi:hypothetical protein
MGAHPINLAVRFLLELAALAALGYWGWTLHEGLLRVVLAIGLPLGAAVLWGTLAVPGDPSRSGRAPVPVPGIVRLALELILFGLAAWALYDAGQPALGTILAAVVVLHYAVSHDRMAWLLKGKGEVGE